MFLSGRHIYSIAEFRTANKGIRQWCKTQTEARKMVLSRLGRIEDKFFRLIPKALAFKPIDDIKDFVYSYVLDEKEVNIELLRENVRTYQELERTLESVKKRMGKLEVIEKYHDEVLACEKKDHMYEYFLQQAELDIIRQTIKITESQMRTEEYRRKEAQEQLEQLGRELESKREMETNLRVELKQNREFLALEEQQKELERLKMQEEHLQEEKRELKKSVPERNTTADAIQNQSSSTSCRVRKTPVKLTRSIICRVGSSFSARTPSP